MAFYTIKLFDGPRPGAVVLLEMLDIFNDGEEPVFAMVSCILCPLIGKHY